MTKAKAAELKAGVCVRIETSDAFYYLKGREGIVIYVELRGYETKADVWISAKDHEPAELHKGIPTHILKIIDTDLKETHRRIDNEVWWAKNRRDTAEREVSKAVDILCAARKKAEQ